MTDAVLTAAKPAVPRSVRVGVWLLSAQAALAAAMGAVGVAAVDSSVARAVRRAGPSDPGRYASVVRVVVYGAAVGSLLMAALYVVLAVKVMAGRRWARAVAWVVAGLSLALTAQALALGRFGSQGGWGVGLSCAGVALSVGVVWALVAAGRTGHFSGPSQLAPSASAGSPPSAGVMGGRAAPPAVPPRNGLATASMVLGVLSIPLVVTVVIGPVLAVLALILGGVALGRVRRGQGGRGRSIAGLATGATGAAAAALAISFVIWLFHTPEYRQERSCAEAARTHAQRNACDQQLLDRLIGS